MPDFLRCDTQFVQTTFVQNSLRCSYYIKLMSILNINANLFNKRVLLLLIPLRYFHWKIYIHSIYRQDSILEYHSAVFRFSVCPSSMLRRCEYYRGVITRCNFAKRMCPLLGGCYDWMKRIIFLIIYTWPLF